MAGQDRTTPGAVKSLPKGHGTGAGFNGSADPLESLLSGGTPSDSDASAPGGGEGEGGHGQGRRARIDRPIDRASREDLFDRLNVQAWGHDFFALVRRIEALHPEEPGFGASARASEDPVRFAQEATMAFPPSRIAQFTFPRNNAPARLFVHFMGMLGPMGPLPLHLTEHALQRELHHKDKTFARFLDIFNHRMVSLFYRAWAASQMPATYDRAGAGVAGDSLSNADRERVLTFDGDAYAVYVGSLFGLGDDEMRYRDAVPDVAKLHFAGRLGGNARGPEGLCSILEKFFGVYASVEEFAGRWMELPEQYWCSIGDGGVGDGGMGGRGGSMSSMLGTQGGGMSVAGRRVWDCQGMFRIRLGAMTYKDYERLLPGTPSAKRLDSWIRNYLGDEFSWEAVLVLRADEVPTSRLGGGTRLGWTSWVRSEANTEDRDDLVVRSPR